MKAWGVASAVAAVLVAGCAASDPEAEIRALLAAAEGAAEARDVGFFGDVLADSYRDAHGKDREETLRMLRGFFIANQRIEIVSRVDVYADAPQASSAAKFGTMGINFRARRARNDEEWNRELSTLTCST